MSAYDEAEDFLEALGPWQSPDSAERFYRDLMGAHPRTRMPRMAAGWEQESFETAPGAAALIDIPAGFRLGVWLDVGGRSLARAGAQHAALLHSLGFSDACVMVNRVEDAGFSFSAVSEATIRVFASLLARSGTRLTLTSWLRPERAFIDDLVRLLPPLALNVGAHAIEFDVEGTWRNRPVRGFADHAQAAEHLFNALRPAASGLEIAVTCEVDPMPTAAMRRVIERADLVVPQAYSTSGSTSAHRIGGAYGPRGIQDRAVQKVGEAVRASGRPIMIGLAAYGRSAWSGTTANAILRMELEHSIAMRTRANILGVRYWSWKHIAGFDAAGGLPAARSGLAFFRGSVSSAGPGAAWTAAPAPPAPVASAVPAASPGAGYSSAAASAPASARPASGRAAPPDPDFESGAARGAPAEADSPSQPVASPAAPAPRQSPAPAPAPSSAPMPRPGATRQRVLQTARIELPLTRGRLQAAKLYDPERDATVLRAVDPRGAAIDLDAWLQSEKRAWLQRHRQIHPVLARRLDRLGDNQRVPILAWIFHHYEPARKEERGETPQLVASREGEMAIPAAPRPHDEPTVDSYTEALRASVRQTIEHARAQFRELGVEAAGDLGTVPVLIAQATKPQVEALSRLPQVTGLYLHEPDGILDLASAITDARAATAHTAGFRGANIPVGIWEQTPRSTGDLAIEATFDASAAAGQNAAERDHAQLVTAVVKNTQASGPRGFAPDAKIYSANTFGSDALAWAVVTKRCSVVNQSFHRASEETDPGLSVDDLIKDYLILHPPFPTIVQAAGNGPATEYVNHKGFNSVTVGNHEDGAGRMRSTSVFKNASSIHHDRELPDLSANGTSVSATGLTKSGTSFASPAVAGSVAVIQSVDATLRVWPEGCRALLLASASPNITGGTWGQAAASPTVDGIDGSGALDTGEAVRIARVRARRDGAAAQRGWDVGRLQTSDLRPNGTADFRYQVQIPASGSQRLKAALCWDSKVVYTSDAAVTPPVRVTESKLTVDLDLYVYHGPTLVAHSSTFDNSFEIVEFVAQAGQNYDIRIKRFSGTDWVWFGLAWTVI